MLQICIKFNLYYLIHMPIFLAFRYLGILIKILIELKINKFAIALQIKDGKLGKQYLIN